MQYDHLHLAEHGEPPDFPAVSWKRVQAFCAAVKRRTGASAWFDRNSKRMHFGYTKTDGTFALTALSIGLREAVAGMDEDDIVRLLQMGKLPPSLKDRWNKSRRDAEKHEESEQIGVAIDAASREADVAVEREYERHTMGKHFRRSHLVSGLKG